MDLRAPAVASWVVAVAAWATPQTATLDWRAPAGCATRSEVEQRVDARLRRPTFESPGPEALRVRGEVSPGPDVDGWTARLAALASDGTLLGSRTLRAPGPDCHALDADVSLVVALMIDPDVLKAPPPPAAALVSPPPEPGKPWGWGLAAAAEAAAGIEPGLSGAARVGVQASPPHSPLMELSGDFWSRNGTPGGAFSLASGGLRVCPTLVRALRTDWRVCAGAQAGALFGRGEGLATNATVVEPLVDAVAEAQAAVRLSGPWFLDAAAGAWVPLVRPRFAYDAGPGVTQPVYQPPAAAFVARIGVGFTFGNNSGRVPAAQ